MDVSQWGWIGDANEGRQGTQIYDPVRKAAIFYQKFVSTHPFYDGNGRLARLIANIYLFKFGLTINWSEFDSRPGFVKTELVP